MTSTMRGGTVLGVPVHEALVDLRTALVSRAIDDRCMALQRQSRVAFQISGAGHEALLVALARSLRAGYDWFFPYYRDLALVLSLGVRPTDVLAQAVGAATDRASGGRQMPAHWSDPQRHIVTQSSPTGSQCLPAVGCAEAGRYLVAHPGLEGGRAESDEVTYVSLGEGTTCQGEFWEALNAAVLGSLPVLFLVADNGWAISVPRREQAPAPISELVAGFPDLLVATCDGTDYFDARQRGAEVVAHLRAGRGPVLLHASVTRPYSHSSMDDQSRYRPAAELAADARRDPIERLAAALAGAGHLGAEELDELRQESVEVAAAAARAAIAAPRPDPVRVTEHLVAACPAPPPTPTAHSAAGRGDGPVAEPLVMGAAIRQALDDLMASDARIRVFGEDVADAAADLLGAVDGKGGVFGTTRGLQAAHGPDRCYNTPLAEAAIIGRAVGQALRGLRPCPEIQFFDYVWPAMQQLRSEAATIRWRSVGGFACPMVVRIAIGGYLSGGAIWHSQCGESIFAHIPGLRIAMPSRAADAVGLLRSAFAGEDPVLFLEHKHLLRQRYAADPYPEPAFHLPFGRGATCRSGDDLTLVTWGATVHRSMDAAAALAAEGAEIEVLDLRTIAPWDRDLVGESVRRTHRLLVVHEDTVTAGFGAEIAAWAAEELFCDLDAPVARVGALDTPVPYAAELERAVLPQVDDIERAARRLLEF